MSKALAGLRNKVTNELPRLSKSHRVTRAIAKQFVKENPTEIGRVANLLIENAIAAIISDVGRRRLAVRDESGQLNLLAHFGLRSSFSIAGSDGPPQRVALDTLTKQQAEEWIARQTREHKRNLVEVAKLQKCLDELAPYLNDEITLAEAASVAREAGALAA